MNSNKYSHTCKIYLKWILYKRRIYITENNCESYAVTFQNKGWIKVQKYEDGSLDENIIYTVNPMETFLDKSQSCNMTALSGAFNKACFDGNTILLKVERENWKK